MDKQEYKSTLNLPKTDFPMKASLAIREPEVLKLWGKDDLYGAIRKLRFRAEKFVLHDGPPYANGEIHMGHALNKILKDIVVKYKTMRGFDSPFVPGWDCHGLPVEHQLFKELKIRKHQIERTEFRKKARDYALKYVSIQREQFKRLGIFGDWEHPYLTLDPAYQATIIDCFGKLYLDGYVYRGLKPIHWCATCETALAEAEVEYDEHRSPSVYVAFEIVSDIARHFPGVKKAAFLIWTTTPWTLPANRAVAVKGESEYVAAEIDHRALIVAKDLFGRVKEELKSDGKILGVCRGKDLEGVITRHPLFDRESPVVLSNHVTLEQGTGCVHIAPGHGDEDYQVGLKYCLEVFAPVNEKGEFTEEAGQFAGLKVEKSNARIIEHLKQKGALLLARELTHQYPHCWRCKQPVIFRATTQWFLGVDRKNLRARTLDVIKGVQWIPERGENRIGSMLELRPDWCLSRQRYWGVPIPMLYCGKCSGALLTPEILALIVAAVRKKGADAWFTEPVSAFLPDGAKCPSCGDDRFRREDDIVDVWFDSGVSHRAVLVERGELGFPSALYLEGSDQHRGWFQTSLLTSVALEGKSPFKAVLTHGFITDGLGKKMSKSAGNVIAPQRIMEQYGADILRLWVSSVDYSVDVRISEDIVRQLVDAYRRIRNTFRFLLGNLSDFNGAEHAVPRERLGEIDRWILSRAERLLAVVTGAYEHYDFCEAFHLLHNFCAVDLSSLYLDILKDCLYTAYADSPRRRSAQTAMSRILDLLMKTTAPILSFTAEEVWRTMPRHGGGLSSIHLADWPAAETAYIDETLENEWEKLLAVRKEVSKALEVARASGMIGNALEAGVTITVFEEATFSLLTGRAALLPDIFIVSRVALEKGKDGEALSVRVDPAPGEKCARCWRYSVGVGENKAHPTICERCVSVVEKT